MRVGYSILKELKNKTDGIFATNYGLKDIEFERMIKLLEKQGYIERVLRVGDNFSLRPARITDKGENFLIEHSLMEEEYPKTKEALNAWVQLDKLKYSNGAEED
ncbi:YjcQ family protein [Paenibacillus harenae]|uniref:DNA-binding PadR family transcriptional regulator n=1 Tax=Paenibacillus harenae TaxID=306543 RepID=A0ABT9U7K9_PAEHA|nr:YjcQ family protein [Paenibacillus harenae]MDQ0115637.1 DNA-binding PadR family transcriptional regulator [Paenibacillus harenae]